MKNSNYNWKMPDESVFGWIRRVVVRTWRNKRARHRFRVLMKEKDNGG